jgi:hypothetical protein
LNVVKRKERGKEEREREKYKLLIENFILHKK